MAAWKEGGGNEEKSKRKILLRLTTVPIRGYTDIFSLRLGEGVRDRSSFEGVVSVVVRATHRSSTFSAG